MKAPLRTLLVAGAAAFGAVGVGAVIHGSAHAAPSPAPLADGSIADVAERVVDSVVNISSSHQVKGGGGPADFDPFYNDPDSPWGGGDTGRKQMSKGSGVIVSPGGRILTNAHVVDGATDIVVTLHDGSEMEARVIGKDPKADLAVIQLKGKVPLLRPLAFGDSSALRLGDVVLAIGDPFGVGKAVTMGIVSAKGRASVGIEDYEDFIQTDAAINPGNSGGALVNMKGELVGINTAILSKTGGYQGIGFAIPTNMAKPIMEMLVKDGKVSRGYLGVSTATLNQAIATERQLAVSRGVYVAGVEENSPAALAGLVQGDIVVGMNGTEMRDAGVFRNSIAMTKPGTTVNLDVIRGSGKHAIKAKLGERTDAQPVNLRRRSR
jgi:Do/DeqQ family serine protease